MVKNPELEIVIGCVDEQGESLKETIPSLMSSLLFADKVTIIADEADTIIELGDYYDVEAIFHENINLVSFDERSYDDINIESALNDKYSSRLNNLKRIGYSDNDISNDPEIRDILRDINDHLQNERNEIRKTVERIINRPEVMPLIEDPNGWLSSNIQCLGEIALGTRCRRQMSAKLGTEIITKIPSFQDLDPLEIYELKRRLSGNLIPFRSYIIEMSSSLAVAGDDQDAIADIIHEIYIAKVIPVVNDLAKQTRDNTFLTRLLNDFGRDPKTFVQSFITLGIGEFAGLPQSLSIGASIASQIISIASNKIETGKSIVKNDLFFVHELDRLTQKINRK